MDLSLVFTNSGTQIKATSVHGILWLQTHFESINWDALIDGNVIISELDAEILSIDANKAGLKIEHFPVFSYSSKKFT